MAKSKRATKKRSLKRTSKKRATKRTSKKRPSKKRTSKKLPSKKRVSKKRPSKRVSKKRVSKKRVSKRVSKKRASKKRPSKKRVSKKRVSKKRPSKRVSKKRVSKKRPSKRVSKKRVSKKRPSKRVSKKRVSKKLPSKKRTRKTTRKTSLRRAGAKSLSASQLVNLPLETFGDILSQTKYADIFKLCKSSKALQAKCEEFVHKYPARSSIYVVEGEYWNIEDCIMEIDMYRSRKDAEKKFYERAIEGIKDYGGYEFPKYAYEDDPDKAALEGEKPIIKESLKREYYEEEYEDEADRDTPIIGEFLEHGYYEYIVDGNFGFILQIRAKTILDIARIFRRGARCGDAIINGTSYSY